MNITLSEKDMSMSIITYSWIVLTFLLLAGISPAQAEQNLLKASTISDELTNEADVVIRLDERTFNYEEPGKATINVRKIITILNVDGLYAANFDLYYDKFSKYKKIKGEMYDSEGERIKRLRGRDIDDRPASSGISLIDDYRIKEFALVNANFPYTIEISYEHILDGFIQIPSWIPLLNERVSLETGRYTISIPDDIDINYRMFNISEEYPTEVTENNRRSFSWEVHHYPTIKTEVQGSLFVELTPTLMLTASEFSMEKKHGSMKTWDELGVWFGYLWQGRDELPDEMKTFVESVVEEYEHPKDIVRALYTHLQSSTRYVSIQLGIGGQQTETAQFTNRNGYGDCKALTNYLYAMLKHAGIESFPALIRNGRMLYPFDPEFVHDQFNHVILFVRLDDEDIWIESTSSNYPLGYIGENNSNRHAVLFSTDSGILVETPKSDSDTNVMQKKATVELQTDGKAIASIQYNFSGSYHEWLRALSRALPGSQRKELEKELSLRTFNIVSIDVTADEVQPIASLEAEVEISSITTSAGSRLFIVPNLLSRDIMQLSTGDRKQDIHIRRGYTQRDEIRFILPEGYEVEVLPAPYSLKFDKGYYKMHVSVSEDGRSFVYHREMVERRGVMPVSYYEDYRSFRSEAVRVDGSQVVIVKK